MLLLVTVSALAVGLLARQVRIKNARIAMKEWVFQHGGIVMPGAPNARIVRLPRSMNQAEQGAVMRVFPEAEVQMFDP
jgi:hypothetical protein